MFESVRALYDRRLPWRLGVPLFSLLPIVVMTAFMEGVELVDMLVPHFLGSAPPSVQMAVIALFAWPVAVPFWLTGRFGLGLAWVAPVLVTQLLIFGTATTWLVRRVQQRRYGRMSGKQDAG